MGKKMSGQRRECVTLPIYGKEIKIDPKRYRDISREFGRKTFHENYIGRSCDDSH